MGLFKFFLNLFVVFVCFNCSRRSSRCFSRIQNSYWNVFSCSWWDAVALGYPRLLWGYFSWVRGFSIALKMVQILLRGLWWCINCCGNVSVVLNLFYLFLMCSSCNHASHKQVVRDIMKKFQVVLEEFLLHWSHLYFWCFSQYVNTDAVIWETCNLDMMYSIYS